MMRRKRGFTLVELMVVVAIIAVLAAIAIPWWGRYAYRARRGDGQNLLMHIAQAEERYYTDYNSYATGPTAASSLGFTGTPTSEHGYYTVALAANPASSAGQSYIATAAPVAGGPQVGDQCKNLTINNTGLKSYTGNQTNGDCW